MNISRSGVLFETDNDVPLGADIDLRIPLPFEGGKVICKGTTVRQDRKRFSVAAKFLKYRFSKAEPNDGPSDAIHPVILA